MRWPHLPQLRVNIQLTQWLVEERADVCTAAAAAALPAAPAAAAGVVGQLHGDDVVLHGPVLPVLPVLLLLLQRRCCLRGCLRGCQLLRSAAGARPPPPAPPPGCCPPSRWWCWSCWSCWPRVPKQLLHHAALPRQRPTTACCLGAVCPTQGSGCYEFAKDGDVLLWVLGCPHSAAPTNPDADVGAHARGLPTKEGRSGAPHGPGR